MRICLLAMGGVRVGTKRLAELGVTLPGFVRRGEIIASLPSLALLTLAAYTPEEFEVVYREIEDVSDAAGLEELKYFDMVAISSYTAKIYDAYRVADMLRAEGVTVVIGGLHATLMPHEAKMHADCVVVGQGEPVWSRLLADFREDDLQAFYSEGDGDDFNLASAPVPRFDLLDMKRYNRITIQTSRGCPHNCEFCASSKVITGKYDQKPVAQVMRELDAVIDRWEYPFIEFADDNTFVNRKWSKEFLWELGTRKIRWFTETDISIADDDAALDMLYQSGCHQLLIGFESISAGSLAGLDAEDWKLRRRDRYLESIGKIQSRGVPVNGCFIVGLDGDTVDVFEEIRDFVIKSRLLEAQVTVLTPFPGTRLYARLKAEGRLLADEYWDRCTLFDVNYRPTGMTMEELEEGMMWLCRELYSDDIYRKRRRHYIDIVKEDNQRREG